jgi:hypothetical protein
MRPTTLRSNALKFLIPTGVAPVRRIGCPRRIAIGPRTAGVDLRSILRPRLLEDPQMLAGTVSVIASLLSLLVSYLLHQNGWSRVRRRDRGRAAVPFDAPIRISEPKPLPPYVL